MEIKWTHYFRTRCSLRHFNIEKAEDILRYLAERYFDIDSSRCIAVGSIDNRLILIPYEEKDNVITRSLSVKPIVNKSISEQETENLRGSKDGNQLL
jgi:hypothetical protein